MTQQESIDKNKNLAIDQECFNENGNFAIALEFQEYFGELEHQDFGENLAIDQEYCEQAEYCEQEEYFGENLPIDLEHQDFGENLAIDQEYEFLMNKLKFNKSSIEDEIFERLSKDSSEIIKKLIEEMIEDYKSLSNMQRDLCVSADLNNDDSLKDLENSIFHSKERMEYVASNRPRMVEMFLGLFNIKKSESYLLWELNRPKSIDDYLRQVDARWAAKEYFESEKKKNDHLLIELEERIELLNKMAKKYFP